MRNRPQNRRNTPRMTSNGNKSTLILSKDLLKRQMLSNSQLISRLPPIRSPELVHLRKPGLDGVGGELRVDVGRVTSSVAGMFAVGLAEEFSHLRDEGAVCREIETGEGDVGCGTAAVEGTGVILLRRRDLRNSERFFPECVYCLCVFDALVG